ncbi:MAG TPA: peptide MFS transporter [Polyangiaceae bacterium]|nr:peptide MFS transporter [Polyangiaceae bacterium]
MSTAPSPNPAPPELGSALPRHPRALAYLLFTETWERFSFYGMKALLVFYLTKAFLFSDQAAYAIYGSYTALVYATPVIGGLLADRLLGFRKAVLIGGVLMALGHFAMAVQSPQVFYLALALLICGNGFFKPNISSLVGRLYGTDDPRRDSAFTIFYMGINLGAFLAPIACGYVGERLGWHWGFGLAGIGMLLGLLVFVRAQPLLAGLAEPPARPGGLRAVAGLSLDCWVYLGTLLAVAIAWQLVQHAALVGSLLIVFGAAVFLGLCVYLVRLPDKIARDRLGVALLLTLVSVVFWSFFEQTGTSMSLFTDRNVDRSLFGALIPAALFQSVDGLFILLLAPLFSLLWLYLARRRLEPNTALKFAFGTILLGLGFAALYVGAETSRSTGVVPMFWLILCYCLHATGELCLSPIGLSMITKLSPKGVTGILMGTWFLAYSFAQYMAALIAQLTGVKGGGTVNAALPQPAETVMVYGSVFGSIGWIALGVGVLLVLVSPLIARRMHGVH